MYVLPAFTSQHVSVKDRQMGRWTWEKQSLFKSDFTGHTNVDKMNSVYSSSQNMFIYVHGIPDISFVVFWVSIDT